MRPEHTRLRHTLPVREDQYLMLFSVRSAFLIPPHETTQGKILSLLASSLTKDDFFSPLIQVFECLLLLHLSALSDSNGGGKHRCKEAEQSAPSGCFSLYKTSVVSQTHERS